MQLAHGLAPRKDGDGDVGGAVDSGRVDYGGLGVDADD